ncbi:hypothetical protein [Rickettsiella grylli]|uniref:hypothetical protein n=1 Tax=Rickettsiella grylli TaxID=59196 RepID=UPI001495F925|nr:hypothetical protein [Rickettsiella grylli]
MIENLKPNARRHRKACQAKDLLHIQAPNRIMTPFQSSLENIFTLASPPELGSF